MLEKFYPGEYLDSTYVIDFDRLYEEGYRGIIFDIDNTLVPHGAPADERACAWATLDTEHGNCSINLTGVSENDYNEYMEILNQEGFSVIENVSEEIEEGNYVSIGTLLSNEDKWLSISYIPDSLTIYISFDNN